MRSGQTRAAPCLGLRRKPAFDPETLSSVWVMACRDESPVLTAYSAAYRLGGDHSGRGHGAGAQGRARAVPARADRRAEQWLEGSIPQVRGGASDKKAGAAQVGRGGETGRSPKTGVVLPDSALDVFDDEAAQRRTSSGSKEWLADDGDQLVAAGAGAVYSTGGSSSTTSAFRSQFGSILTSSAEPSDLATTNWGLGAHRAAAARPCRKSSAEWGGPHHRDRRRRDRCPGRPDGTW